MGYKVLYRKYRPNNFNELVGQNSIKDALINAIVKNKLSHAYIFTGPRGTGKTSMAKIFAKALTCMDPIDGICCDKCVNCLSFNENPDIIEIDAASNNGVDEIREIRNNVKLVPTMSRYKIYIVDEVHMLSNSAWNAFLKTLEEPPSHVIFIFATTEINKVPVTVLSRCQRYDFHKISTKEIKEHLNSIALKENFQIEDAALNEIIKLSDGCLRDALSYLDQLAKVSNNIDLQLVGNVFGIVSHSYLKKLLTSIYSNNIDEFLGVFDDIIGDGIDCNSLINDLIDYLLKDAVKNKKREQADFNFEFCYRLINDLFAIQKGVKYIDNAYKNLEIVLLNYFETVKIENNDKIHFDKLPKNKDEKKEIISREIISNNKNNISQEINDENLEKLKSIRTNNVFVGAKKDLKTNFISKWKEFISQQNDINNYILLGYISNATIEVVNSEYVLFSTNLSSDSVMFNNNLNVIEDEFFNFTNKKHKFIAISDDEWLTVRDEFIKNKFKERKIISEDILKSKCEDKTVDEAQDIFGDIIEIN